MARKSTQAPPAPTPSATPPAASRIQPTPAAHVPPSASPVALVKPAKTISIRFPEA